MTTPSNRDQAITLAAEIYDSLARDRLDQMSHDAIDYIISDLRTLHSLMGGCSDVDLAIHHLEKMKRPRADKYAEGQSAKDAAYGAKIMAHNMAD